MRPLLIAAFVAVASFVPYFSQSQPESAQVTASAEPVAIQDAYESPYNLKADVTVAEKFDDGVDLGHGCCYPNDRPRVFRPFTGGPIRRAFWLWCWLWWN